MKTGIFALLVWSLCVALSCVPTSPAKVPRFGKPNSKDQADLASYLGDHGLQDLGPDSVPEGEWRLTAFAIRSANRDFTSESPPERRIVFQEWVQSDKSFYLVTCTLKKAEDPGTIVREAMGMGYTPLHQVSGMRFRFERDGDIAYGVATLTIPSEELKHIRLRVN